SCGSFSDSWRSTTQGARSKSTCGKDTRKRSARCCSCAVTCLGRTCATARRCGSWNGTTRRTGDRRGEGQEEQEERRTGYGGHRGAVGRGGQDDERREGQADRQAAAGADAARSRR